jgi:MFS family permease
MIVCSALYSVCLMQSGSFNWNTKQQGVVLAAFFYGYITTQILGGTLAQRIGGKFLLLFGIFWTALLTLLTPIATIAGDYGAIVAVRLLEGIGEVSKQSFMLSVGRHVSRIGANGHLRCIFCDLVLDVM